MSSRALFESLVRAVTCGNSCKLQSFIPSRHCHHPRTNVFERRHEMRLVGKGKFPLVKKRHYIYKVVPQSENYSRTMQCILTKEVEGLGMEGQIVEVLKSHFRNNLYPLGFAVYASPHNIEKYEEIRKSAKDFGVEYETKVRLQKLGQTHVNVYMNTDTDWILDENHIRIALRQLGFVLDNENIIFDKEVVVKPGRFTFWVQVQKLVCIQLQGTVHPYGGTYEGEETDDKKSTETTTPALLFYTDVFGPSESDNNDNQTSPNNPEQNS